MESTWPARSDSPASRKGVAFSADSNAGSNADSDAEMTSSYPPPTNLGASPTRSLLKGGGRAATTLMPPGSDEIEQQQQQTVEYTGPKLFVKPSGKSNVQIIINAIKTVCLAGSVNADLKKKVLEELEKSEGKHFLILFRDAGCQYRGMVVLFVLFVTFSFSCFSCFLFYQRHMLFQDTIEPHYNRSQVTDNFFRCW